MMNIEEIIRLERENTDGQTIHLFFHEMTGLYYAYGLSAYYTTIAVDPMASFSEELNMPVVMLNKSEVLRLRQCMTILEHIPKCYYKFRLKSKLGNRWYENWVKSIRL